MSLTEHEIMQRAIRLAANGLYTTEPNPRVGCVLVKDGVIVGEGWHHKAGGPHAEIEALRAAGDAARGATAFVTLEPCCHTGKTGPCTQALIDAGVSRVVAAMQDPNPLVAGKGLAMLADNGVSVSDGLLQTQAEALNPGFISRMRHGRPYVRLKMAMSLDGRTAMASGESKWITSDAARLNVQRLRARSSAILTGIGTVLQDDPRLDVRLDDQDINAPLKVVLDSQARMPSDARLLATRGEVLQITAADVEASASCQHATVARDDDGLDLAAVMRLLAEREINELHVECGAVLAGALIAAQLVDEIVLYIAPHLMGDAARGLFHLPALSQMSDRVKLSMNDMRMVGDDMRLILTIER